MAFSYGTRKQHFINVAKADELDRIKVTLDNDAVVTLSLATKPDAYWPELQVERDLTNESVLEELYKHAARQRNGCSFSGLFGPVRTWWYRRHGPTLEEARQGATLRLSVREDGDAFDNSPRVGERLKLTALMPHESGSGWGSKQLIKDVEFYRLEA